MDKNAIKKYAVWARRELIKRVSQKAEQYEITEKKITPADVDSIGGRVLTVVEKKQRQLLVDKINRDGFEQVMEEVAYTWFNRFTAIRFMEVNNYLPSHTRVFTNENGEFKPQILADAIQLDLDGLDMDKVYELKNANKTEELYKYLLIVQCNALSAILPRMFQKIEHYTELLLPDYLLREGSVIQQMIELIPEEDWKDAVQIIGWLYQYYNSEKKDDVFAALKKNVKITKENIPAATQLFTPDWIVRYMVENSLGRLWLEGHPDAKEQLLPTEKEQSAYVAGNHDPGDGKWHYYLEEAEQESEVQTQLHEIRKEYAALTPDQLKVIDPCSGSGHILVYTFDVLMKIYESYGYDTREAVVSIVENNLYGLDIDDRAAQLAYFALMMKARQYDRRFFSRGIQPHVYAIVESNHINKFAVDYFCNGDAKLKEAMDTIISELHDAKEYGSILTITPQDWSALYDRVAEITEDINMSREIALRELLPLVQVAEALGQKYDVVVTNPPYAGVSNLSDKVNDFVKKNYPDSKADLFAVFIERCNKMTVYNGFQAMITQHAWMFLSSFEKMRKRMMLTDIINMIHLGARAFEEIGGEVVQTTSFVRRQGHNKFYKATYCRLVEPNSQQGKEDMFCVKENRYYTEQENFAKIPGSPVAYWVSKNLLADFTEGNFLKNVAEPKSGLSTTDNNRFLRFWYEVSIRNISFAITGIDETVDATKWFPIAKGGEYRKWYGNNDYVVNWLNNGAEIKEATKGAAGGRIVSPEYYFKKFVTWSGISSGKPSMRISDHAIFGSGAKALLSNNGLYNYLAFLNSKVSLSILKFLSPTLNYEAGHIGNIPICFKISEEVENITIECINISRKDWDSFETSWDFQYHPLICKVSTIAEAFEQWKVECDKRFNRLKANEEELNRIFIDIYGLQDELTPEVEDKDVTVRKADLQRDIRSLISYAVGCMFGRYSIYKPGLLFAGEPYSLQTFVDKLNDQPDVITQDQLIHEYIANGIIINKMFEPDCDNIIPICDDEYFEDDIVGRFVEFIEVVYGKETLEENLMFIADALGGKGTSREIIRNYFINDFYADHLKVYQKRPIYWLFDSGKKNGFKCLIYMHRYQPDTLARIRTDYVHEQQSRYRTAIADLEQRINGASTPERTKLNKQITKLQVQATELREYEEKIHHLADQMISIDLDDGVKHNYEIFKDVLAKIK